MGNKTIPAGALQPGATIRITVSGVISAPVAALVRPPIEAISWTFPGHRSTWLAHPEGPWDLEPDAMQWGDEGTGLPCLILRNEDAGNWCGYVGVKEYRREYADLEVHGGVTFYGGELIGVVGRWVGFDCAHYKDLKPSMGSPSAALVDFGFVYRDWAYVFDQVTRLAAQIAALG